VGQQRYKRDRDGLQNRFCNAAGSSLGIRLQKPTFGKPNIKQQNDMVGTLLVHSKILKITAK
jgi:hypothetical protein